MLQLTKALRDHAVKHFGVAANASEADFRRVIGLKLATGALSATQLSQLVADKAAPAAVANDVIDRALATQPVPPRRSTAVPQRRAAPVPARTPARNAAADPNQPARAAATPQQRAASAAVPNQVTLDAAISRGVAAALKQYGITPAAAVTPESVLSRSEASRVRVKSAAESYSNTRKGAIYPQRSGVRQDGTKHLLAGLPAEFGGRPLDHPSDLDKAVSSAYLKWCIKSTTAPQNIPSCWRMTDHDNDLIHYALRSLPWTGLIGGKDSDSGATKVKRRRLNELEVKGLLDDSVSGGIEAAPIAFDDAIILTPVLYGELFPLVTVKNIARGRRIKGAAMTNPTFTSGVAEGTAITPFNTSGFVTAFDTPIFPATGAMEIGLDFEEDSPADLGSQIIENYGFKALEWLDRVIAVGDGVTEPLGVLNSTGTGVVNSDNGPGGPLTVSDYEGLMFGVAKQFRFEAGATPIYMSNDTMYRRAVSIPVGPGDERRVFGLDHADYQMMNRPYKVQNNIANGQVAFFNAKRYRMYRRLGLSVKVETQGRTLALSNTRLIVLRMRYGGQLEIGGAAAVMTDGQL